MTGCENTSPSIRYSQVDNIIETAFKDLKTSGQLPFWLESCNVCSACCAIEAVGGKWKMELPQLQGDVFMGYDDLMFAWMFSPIGQRKLPIVQDGTMENEVAENLSCAIMEMSTCASRVVTTEKPSFAIKNALQNGRAVCQSYLTDYGSGHYICIVGFEGDTFYCYDSWAGNKHCKTGGILEKYNSEFFDKRARKWLIEVWT